MWNIFKKKEQIIEDKNKEVLILNETNEQYLNTFCMLSNMVFIFKGFELVDNEIQINIVSQSTPKGYISHKPFWIWELQYDNSLKTARMNWVKFVAQLNYLDIELKLLNTNKEK